jgi:hypothetical protein
MAENYRSAGEYNTGSPFLAAAGYNGFTRNLPYDAYNAHRGFHHTRLLAIYILSLSLCLFL